MADRVADADAPGPGSDRRRVELADVVGVRPGRVLGHVHDRKPLAHGERHGRLGQAEHAVEVPVLGVLPDRRGADEAGDLDRDPDALRDLDDRQDVGLDGPRGAVGPDLHPRVHDLARQPFDRGDDVRARARQADVRRVDAERLHQVEDRDLVLDRRAPHGRRLEPVAQRLVVDLDGARGPGKTAPPALFQS